MKRAAIFGAGGLGRMVLDTLRRCGVECVAFLDSDPAKHGRRVDGVPVRGGLDACAALRPMATLGVVVAIGDNVARCAIAQSLRVRGLRLASAIHPLASIAASAEIGEHVIIGPRAAICVHARIGAHSIVSAGAIVEHDCELDSAVFLHPAVRLAGGVRVGAFSTLDIGACVIPGRRIGAAAHVEAGAVVIRDVPAEATAGGAPAAIRSAARSRFVSDGAAEQIRARTSARADAPAGESGVVLHSNPF